MSIWKRFSKKVTLCFEKLSPHGLIVFYQRYKGTIRQEMDIHEFPFDQHLLKINIGSYIYSAKSVKYVSIPTPLFDENLKNVVKCAEKLPEWQPCGNAAIYEKEFLDEDKRGVSEIHIDVPLQRKSGFYLTNVFSTIFCLNVLSWGIYTISITDFGDRLNLYFTLFLALVAFAFVLAELVPKVSHATPITSYLTLNYVITALSAIEGYVCHLLVNYDSEYLPYVESFERFFALVVVTIESLVFFRFFIRSRTVSYVTSR